jgi:hypothetical protein
MEQLTYNMMFRWFVGLSMDVPVWDVTVFTKNRERLLSADIACSLLQAILADPRVKPLLSDEHFSVDGTLIEAWASMKSFRPKDGSGEAPGPSGEAVPHGPRGDGEPQRPGGGRQRHARHRHRRTRGGRGDDRRPRWQ